MIETDKRKAIFLLHQEGMSKRQISKRLGVNPKTVSTIIKQKGLMPAVVRRDKQQIDPQLLRRLYGQCGGWIQRMHEKLQEEEGIQVKYSTLTRLLRELGISAPQKTRCERVPDEPGAEMQHDTTLYTIKLADKPVKIVASILYLRYSKRRYLKFYRNFDRFKMKCFIHEALMFWGYAPGQCIIDNTNLARLRGTGRAAVMVGEMQVFSKQYGFEFLCHEIRHANRKAGEERSFWTTETNFLPGRSFQSLEDLNEQAFKWATVRMENRPQGKAELIPAIAFEHEYPCLAKLPSHLPAPYRIHERYTDQYGYVSFNANYYWIPGSKRDVLKVLEYAQKLKIYLARECLIEYPLPAKGVRNQLFKPPGLSKTPHKPRNRKQPAEQEEKQLRALAPSVNAYLDWALKLKGLQRHRFLRKLLTVSQKMNLELFVKCIQRAHQYRITSIETIKRIAVLYFRSQTQELPWAPVDEQLEERETYQQGYLTDPPDLSIYDIDPEEDENE